MTIRMMNISDVVKVNPRLPTDLAKEVNRDVDFVPMAQLSEQGFVKANATRALGEVKKGYTYFANGDVIVAKITPCMENGKAAYVTDLPHEVAFGSTEFHVLRPGPDVDGRYLFYMLWNPVFRNTAEANMTGSAGQKRVPAKFFSRFRIPLPPLSEQKRIADILDKADAIRRKRQEAIGGANLFLRSAFLEMFGDPASPNAQTQSLSDVALVVMGTSPPGNTYNEVGDGEPLINGPVEFGKEHPAEIQWTTKPNKMSETGDILFCVRGATAGKLNWSDKPYCIGRGVAAVRSKGQDRNHDRFVYLCLALGYDYFQRIGTGSTFININRSVLESFPIPVATESQISQIREIAATLDQAKSKLEKSLDDSEHLFNSLVQRAFKGEL